MRIFALRTYRPCARRLRARCRSGTTVVSRVMAVVTYFLRDSFAATAVGGRPGLPGRHVPRRRRRRPRRFAARLRGEAAPSSAGIAFPISSRTMSRITATRLRCLGITPPSGRDRLRLPSEESAPSVTHCAGFDSRKVARVQRSRTLRDVLARFVNNHRWSAGPRRTRSSDPDRSERSTPERSCCMMRMIVVLHEVRTTYSELVADAAASIAAGRCSSGNVRA